MSTQPRRISRCVLLEALEDRRLMTATPSGQLASNFIDAESALIDTALIDLHEHEHDDHDHDHDHSHDHLFDHVIKTASESDNTAASWNAGTPANITHVVTIQPIILSDDDGSNTAEYFGNATQQAIIHDLIDQIWAQAGVDVEWLSPNYWNNSFANVGNGSSSSTRPQNDLSTIVTNGDQVGVGNSDPLVLDMYFAQISAGFQELGEYYANGLAYVDGNGSTVHVGDQLPSFTSGREVVARVVAHEIGHNLGLGHVTDTANLMDDGELLDSTQVSTSRSSDYTLAQPTTINSLGSGESAVSADGSYQLTLQADGNLVLYDVQNGTATWHTHTYGLNVTNAVMQADGNFVMYSGSTPVWHSHTYGNPGATLKLDDTGTLSVVSANGATLWTNALSTGQSLMSPNGQYQLTLQNDGNLVLYNLQDASVVWHSNTYGNNVTNAVMQADGNFVMYNGTTPIWHTHTSSGQGGTLTLEDDGTLSILSSSRQALWSSQMLSGDSIVSANGRYELVLQTDGNLVLYDRELNVPLWHTETHGINVTKAVLQADGNFVLYSESTPVWHSQTFGNAGASMDLGDDGNLKILSQTGSTLWEGRM